MKTVYYSAGRLMVLGAGCAGFAVLCFWALGHVHGFKFLICLIGLPFFALGAPLAFFKAMGDRVAVRYDASSVYMATLWRGRAVLWSEVDAIGIEQLNTYALYGLVKTGSTKYLTLRRKGGLPGSKKLRVTAKLLDLPVGGLEALVVDLERARNGVVTPVAGPIAYGVNSPNRNRDPLEGVPAPTDAPFDPDAIMARYMANRDTAVGEAPRASAQPQPQSRPAVRQFGRLAV